MQGSRWRLPVSAGTAIRVTAASQLTLAEDSWIPGSGYKAGLGEEVGVAALSMSAPLTPRVFRTGVGSWCLQVEARVTARLSCDVPDSPQQRGTWPQHCEGWGRKTLVWVNFCPLEAKGTNAGLCFFFTS